TDSALAVDAPADGRWAEAFAAAHGARYGYTRPGRAIEIVTARVQVTSAGASPPGQGGRPDHPASNREAIARSEAESAEPSEVNRFATAQQPNRPQADSRSEAESAEPSEVNRFATAQQPNRPQADSRSEAESAEPSEVNRFATAQLPTPQR